jgi:hypothetical protein
VSSFLQQLRAKEDTAKLVLKKRPNQLLLIHLTKIELFLPTRPEEDHEQFLLQHLEQLGQQQQE